MISGAERVGSTGENVQTSTETKEELKKSKECF